MTRRPVRFLGDGIALDGDLYFAPDGRDGDRRPALVACSGYLRAFFVRALELEGALR